MKAIQFVVDLHSKRAAIARSLLRQSSATIEAHFRQKVRAAVLGLKRLLDAEAFADTIASTSPSPSPSPARRLSARSSVPMSRSENSGVRSFARRDPRRAIVRRRGPEYGCMASTWSVVPPVASRIGMPPAPEAGRPGGWTTRQVSKSRNPAEPPKSSPSWVMSCAARRWHEGR